MPTMENADYNSYSVKDWLEKADRGEVALPTYQRSYIWANQRIADYLKALFENRPTGIFLVLKNEGRSTFKSRTLSGVDANPDKAKILVLDGQQRLTSLWSVLKGQPTYQFYVEVKDLKNRKLEVQRVRFFSNNSTEGREVSDHRVAYERNLVPIAILSEGSGIESCEGDRDPDDPGRIWEWCILACNKEHEEARRLESAIQKRLNQTLLLQRHLHYCALPRDTDPSVAINIFVETNQSSAKIKEVDIVVARAQAQYNEDLRKRIKQFWDTTPILAHYFSHDLEAMIPEIGEWIFKVACLKIRNFPPKKQRFAEALNGLFEGGNDCGLKRINALQEDLKEALNFASQNGGSTKRTLAAWPPIHVIAALQDDLRSIRKPPWQGTANKLISAYLWRSYLTDRYEKQANDKLHADFLSLRECLKDIRNTGIYKRLPPIFKKENHPVPSAKSLENSLQWISRGRLGPAIAGLVMRKRPLDWVTGRELNENYVRDLEHRRKLDRHHVFPSKYLKGHVAQEKINNGLNGVLLSKDGNLSLGSQAPDLYLKKVLKNSPVLKKDEIRDRVNSHLIPYDALMSQGAPKVRYEYFISQRAKLLAKEIETLVTL